MECIDNHLLYTIKTRRSIRKYTDEPLPENVRVKGELRRIKRHIYGIGSRKNGVRAVILVKWRKYDYLVAFVANRHHGAHHGFRTAAGYKYIFIGVKPSA